MVFRGTEIPQLIRLKRLLHKTSSAQHNEIWKRVEKFLDRSTRRRVEINVGRLNRIANAGDTLVVPGKVLALGTVSKKFTVAAWAFAKPAAAKLQKGGVTMMTIEALVAKNPKGSKVRIVI